VLVASLPGDAPDLPTWARQDLRRLESTPPVSRSDAEPAAPPIRLISPDPGNASLVGDRPTFAWAPVPNAASYTAVLTSVPEDIDEAPREIESVTVSRPAYQPSQPLERGRRYRLTVRALTGQAGGTEAAIDDTMPIETTWIFRVLSPDEVRQAQWAEANAMKHPVPAAMALYRLDRLADAARIKPNWPDQERLSGWKAALSRMAEQRRADPSQ
jgi:hypothetical protein